LHFEKL
jgi:hypothetical protein